MKAGESKNRMIQIFRKAWRWSGYVVASGLVLILLVVGLDFPIEEDQFLFLLFYVMCWVLSLCCFVNVSSMVLISVISLRGTGLSLLEVFFGWCISVFLGIFGGFMIVLLILGMSGYGQ